MLLGVVKRLFKNHSDQRPGVKGWPAALHIPIQPYHGGYFNGNDRMKLLKGSNKL